MPLKIDMDKSPKAQLEALRNRQKLITTSKWNELEKEAHDKAFTVAKVMSADVLQDIYDYIQSAVKEGWSYDTFKKKVRDGGLVERMQNAGWLKTATDKQIGARLQVIIDTNVKMAYGKGNYNRLMLVKDKKPYWIYHQVERKTKRAEHSIYNGRKFHCDDPIWNTIYPPSGFRCSCWVEAVAEPDGVESGSNIEINPDEHPISPLSVWKPETTKYVEGIGKALEGTLRMKEIGSDTDWVQELLDAEQDWDKWYKLDCAVLDKPHFSSIEDAILFSKRNKRKRKRESNNNTINSSQKKCDPIAPNQPTWVNYGLEEVNKILSKDLGKQSFNILPEIEDNTEAIAKIFSIITNGTNKPHTIENSIQSINVNENIAVHMIYQAPQVRRDDHREKFAGLLIPTLTEADEIWKTKYTSIETGDEYYNIAYIKYCKVDKNRAMFAVARYDEAPNNYMVTFVARDDNSLNNRRVGELIYNSSITKQDTDK